MKKYFRLFGVLLALVLSVALASCETPIKKAQPDPVDATSIKYDGTKFTWNVANNADAYKIVVSEDGKANPEVSVASNSYAKAAKKDVNEMSIQITSYNSQSEKSSDAVSASFSRLATITQLNFDQDGVLSWDEVDGANAYSVKIVVGSKTKEEITTTTSFEDFPRGKDAVKISVKPILTDGSYFSDYSAVQTKYYLTAPQVVSYDDTDIKWETIPSAYRYELYIDGQCIEDTLTRSTYSYPATGSSFTIQVRAVGDGVNSFSSEKGEEVKYLPTIKEFDVVGTKITWDEVVGADRYRVTLVGGGETVVNGTEYIIQAGKDIKVKVRPELSSGKFLSNDSKVFNCMVLAAPTNIKYVNGAISWTGNANAKNYEVYINESLHGSTGTTASYQFDSQKESFSIQVKALGDNTYSFPSEMSETVRYTYLATVTDVTVNEQGSVVWNKIQGAEKYKVKINNGSPVEVDTNEYKNITSNVTYSFEIMPIATGNYFSSYSTPKTIYILPTPTVSWIGKADATDGNARTCINWAQVSNSTGYTVRVSYSGAEEPVDTDCGLEVRSFDYGFNAVGTYTLQVRANVDQTQEGYYSSTFSTPITVVRIPGPQAKATLVTSTRNNFEAGFDINYTLSDGASAVKLVREGTEITGSSPNPEQYHVPASQIDTAGLKNEGMELTYKLQAIGRGVQKISESTIVYLSSLDADSLPVHITVLGTPNDVSFEGFTASWTGVPGAVNKYSVEISTVNTVDNTSFNLEQLAEGPHTFRVCANGDGESTLASPYSPKYNLFRLYRVTGLRISVTAGSENKLTWEPVLNAKSYQAIFNGATDAVPVVNNDSISNHINSTGVTIDMIAVGNYKDDTNQTYYITSPGMSQVKTFYKLETPTFGEVLVTDGYLQWNHSANVNTQAATPSYRVWDYNSGGNAQVVPGDLTATQMELDGHAYEGESNTFAVQAIGDGKDFINSDISETVNFFYLATPAVSRDYDSYKWFLIVNATAYEIYIDNGKDPVKVIEDPNETTYKVDLQYFKDIKDYTVKVIAKGDGGRTIVDSKPATFTQTTIKAKEPNFTWSYATPQFASTSDITITVNEPTDYSRAYKFSIGGGTSGELTFVSEETPTYSYCPGAPGSYDLYCWAVGGVFDKDGKLYLESDHRKKTVVILDGVSSIELTTQGQLRWIQVNPAKTGFEYEIKYKDETETTKGTVVGNTLDLNRNLANCVLPDGIEYSNIESITIRTVGGANTIKSEDQVYEFSGTWWKNF